MLKFLFQKRILQPRVSTRFPSTLELYMKKSQRKVTKVLEIKVRAFAWRINFHLYNIQIKCVRMFSVSKPITILFFFSCSCCLRFRCSTQADGFIFGVCLHWFRTDCAISWENWCQIWSRKAMPSGECH